MIDWTQLTEEQRAMLRRAAMPDFVEWERKIRATGGCSNPVRMRGGTVVADATTGELLDAYSTDDSSLGYLMIPCGNRRAELCPACSEVYRYDARQLVRAGLAGGKGVPVSVALHPMLFVTLTAPSFGPVHARHKQTGKDGLPKRCHVRRDASTCPHGTIMSCAQRHDEDDCQVGQALCLDCYDYMGAVLFNANAGDLWRRLGIYLRRELARAVGISRAALSRVARVSYVKVAEYQTRGVVHFHAVIRIDGPDGPSTPPPDWATVVLLDSCLRRALATVRIEVPDPNNPTTDVRVLRFGTQVDTQAIYTDAETREDGLSMRAVAGYIAKYATKAAETAGSTPRPIKNLADLDYLQLPAHTERMVRACFALAVMPAFKEMGFYRTAHMLGYRGHCATKSRKYSTTFGTLRGERKAYRDAERRERLGLPSLDGRQVVIDSKWMFIRAGLAYGEAAFVNAIQHGQRMAHVLSQHDAAGDPEAA